MRTRLIMLVAASLLMVPTVAAAQDNGGMTRLGGADRSETSLVAAKAKVDERNKERFDRVVVVDAGSDKDGATAMLLANRMESPVILVWPKLGLKDKALEPILRPGGEIVVVGKAKAFSKVGKALERDGFTITYVDPTPTEVGKAAGEVPKQGFAWMENLPVVGGLTPRQGDPKVILAVPDGWQERMVGANVAARQDGMMVSGVEDLKQTAAAFPKVPVKRFGAWKEWPAEIPFTEVANKDIRTLSVTESTNPGRVFLARAQGKSKKPMFADALIATTVAGKDGIVVLTDSKLVDKNLRTMLKPLTEDEGATVIGGEAAISKQVGDALGWAK